MTTEGIKALESLSNEVTRLAEVVTEQDWTLPSACPGWNNHDVLIHFACTLREVVEPDSLPEPVPGSIERTNDVAVAQFRGESISQTLDTYQRLIGPALEALTALQNEPDGSEVVDFDDAGSYPAHLIVDSLVFDHYCHLRHDLASPRGRLTALDIEVTDLVMRSSLTWLIAGLPQMSPRRLSATLTAPVALKLTGPGGGIWTLASGRDAGGVTIAEGSVDPAATITSTADSFHLWGTHRGSRHDLDVSLGGNAALASAVLDAIHVF
ncbi:maleylpyruvate isomerase N-terminal domain-containing protein [Rhodococcus sp. NPDC057529]|uniref:maleylpyruvate isomerase N-terminal domain-containing protein n=1 Tax=Rhodococcus sp. NPDC057529 TaxID=3346158 RepID=UPI00366B1765